MIHNAKVTPHTRRTFGLTREVYVVRCRPCAWITEVRQPALAFAIARGHNERDDA